MADDSRTPLQGKVALVTGAARRVGRAIAMELGTRGAMVAVHYRSSDKEADAVVADLGIEGAYARAFQADLGDGLACAKLVESVVAWKGRLDVLVNSASVFQRLPLVGNDDAAWESVWAEAIDVNLLAPARLARHAAPHLRANRGVIVNILDICVEQSWPSYTAYGASKAGLAWLTRSLAAGLAPEIRVAGVSPGIAAFPEELPPDARERLVARIPLGRPGSPEAIARAVSFLCTADYVTGAILPVDGGRLAAAGE